MTQGLICLCLHAHSIDVDLQDRRKCFADRLNMRPEFRTLGYHGRIDVSDRSRDRQAVRSLAQGVQARSSAQRDPCRESACQCRQAAAPNSASHTACATRPNPNDRVSPLERNLDPPSTSFDPSTRRVYRSLFRCEPRSSWVDSRRSKATTIRSRRTPPESLGELEIKGPCDLDVDG